MKNTIQTAIDSTYETIDKSSCDEPTKLYYRSIITKSGECTNGLTKEEKLQGVSEICFYLSELFIRRDISNTEHFTKIDKKLDSLSAKIDVIAEHIEKSETKPKSRLEIIMGSLQNIQWWWAASFTAVVGILAYKDQILEVLKRIL